MGGQNPSQIVKRLGKVRQRFQRFLVVPDCLLGFVLAGQRRGQMIMRRRVVGLDPQRGRKGLHGLSQLPLPGAREAQLQPGGLVFGLEPKHLGELFNGPVKLALVNQQLAQTVMGRPTNPAQSPAPA